MKTRVAHNYRSDINVAYAVYLYNTGLSGREIAERFNCEESVILRRFKAIGFEVRKQNTYDKMTSEVLTELYINQKKSVRSIAAIFGCGKTLVNKRLKKYGIPLRKNAGDPSFSVQERKDKWGQREELHPRWKGGVTKVTGLIRNRLSYLSQECFRRDDFKCTCCGKPSQLHAHHKRPFSEILDDILAENPHINLQDEDDRIRFVGICESDARLTELNNLTTLCEDCHKNEHSVNPVRVVHHDILEKQWRDFVTEHHTTMSVSEMGKQINVYPYRIISFMKNEGLTFAYENREWLANRLRTSSCSYIAREFNSRKYRCFAKDIRKKAYEFGLVHYLTHQNDSNESEAV